MKKLLLFALLLCSLSMFGASPTFQQVTNIVLNSVGATNYGSTGRSNWSYMGPNSFNETNKDGGHIELNGGVAFASGRFQAGTNVASYSNYTFLSAEQVTAHAHYAFGDRSTVNYSGVASQGHASYDAVPNILGTQNSSHHHGYQDSSLFGGSGTLSEYAGFYCNPRETNGTITKLMGFEYIQPQTPWIGGTVNGQFAVYVHPLSVGGSNYAVYTEGTTPSFFGGAVQVVGRLTDGNGAYYVTNGTGSGAGDVTTAQLNDASSNRVRVVSGPGISVVDDGTTTANVRSFTISATNNPVTMTMTNFVSGQIYSNASSSPILVSATAYLVPALVNGNCSLDLMYSQTGGTNYQLLARTAIATLLTGGITLPITNTISGVITNLGNYYFTNTSSGSGDSAGLVDGTGQLTVLGGSGGSSTSVSTATVTGAGTDYSLTTSYTHVTFGTTSPDLTLPSAGTYDIQADMLFAAGSTAGDTYGCQLFNNTTSANIGNLAQCILAGSYQNTLHLNAIVTVSGASTIWIRAKNGTGARGSIIAVATQASYRKY